MGLWQRLRRRAPVEERTVTNDTYAAAFGIMSTASGAYVSPRLAENLATVSACIGAVASTLASLPALTFLRTSTGRTEAPTHPVARLTRQPNEHQSWPDWMEQTVASVLSHGNALSTIEYDGAGRVTALNPVPWPLVSPLLLPSGRLAFDVSQASWMGGTGRTRRYMSDEVFYLKDRSDDGLIGRSRISRAPDVLANAQALQDFAGHSWRNQATPSGAIQFKMSLTRDQRDSLRQQLDNRYTGTANAGRVIILDNDSSWQSLSVSPEDAEVLASRRFSVEELCRLFQVPPPIVQDYTHNTFTNSQQAALWFAQFSLTPWARKIEAEFARSVFGPSSPYELEIDLSGLMRGDYPARWAAYAIARDKDILSVSEIREAEGWGPQPTDASAGGAA